MKVISKKCVALVLSFLFCFMGFSAFAVQEEQLFETLKKPAYRASWDAMFKGEKNVPSWITNIGKGLGQTSPCKASKIDDIEYTVHTVCKPHDCGANNFMVFFAPNGTQAWGVLIKTNYGRSGKLVSSSERFFGNPNQKMKDALIKAKDCESPTP